MPNDDLTALTLENVCGGAAPEAFEEEVRHIIENVLDVNTRADAKRALTITFTFLPSEERDDVKIVMETKTKLAPFKTAGGVAFIGRDRRGKAVAMAANFKQLGLPWEEDGRPRPLESPEAAPAKAEKAG